MFRKLAWANIKNNKRYYIPYIVSCVFSIVMFYTVTSLALNPNLYKMRGGMDMQLMLRLGIFVVALFSIIFIFYINSFLMKQRTKEFGLFNILGLEKKHIDIIVFYETFMTSVFCLVLGIVFGVLLDKGMYLLILNVFHMEIQFGFYISIDGIIYSLILFSCIFLAAYFWSVIRIQILNPVELMSEGQKGQKEPKNKWILALLGLICLGSGYYLALWVKNPLSAFLFFFVAVILVVIGTYCLFTFGSITLLKLLEKNKTFYYKTRHFINISNMKYRMNQNGVGLANICILSTMILVALSTTISLWTGFQDNLNRKFPYDISIRDDINYPELKEVLYENCPYITDINQMQYLSFSAEQNHQSFNMVIDDSTVDYGKLVYLVFIDQDMYHQFTGKEVNLKKGEILLQGKGNFDSIQVQDMFFKVKGKCEESLSSMTTMTSVDSYSIVLDSQQTLQEVLKMNELYYKDHASSLSNMVFLNLEENINKYEVEMNLYSVLSQNEVYVQFEGKEIVEQTLRAFYVGFLFIGVFISALFMVATVLIMYYKQISEGLQDKNRFEVMRKVGLDEEDIKKTINSQILMLFFLPLVMTGLHLAFAFPMISKLLILMQMNNTELYIQVTLITFCIFSLVYIFMYIQTSRVYYRIVHQE
ncbi:ABC transporter permease [Floccifex sp.]|uniref:ABC transporter permease n=1 Tax=Floccifex sp. TaxID=2815810 RepID=UPI003F00B01E